MFKENKESIPELYFECTYLLQEFSMAKFVEMRGGQNIGHFRASSCKSELLK